MNSGPVDPLERFSLIAGGPFNRALCRFGLAGADQLPTRRAVIVVALMAWLPPALLAAVQSVLDGDYRGWGYFSDWTVHARFLIAIGAMIATERYADGRILTLARHFRESRLLSDEGLSAFRAELGVADRRSSSALAEGIILVVALAWSSVTVPLAAALAGSSWEGTVIAGQVSLSWAGEATRFLSNPLFLFLVLRWFWWFALWTILLYRISRLPLQLTPLHPDRSAGLGFLTMYPGIYSGLAFALSCVIASNMVKDLALEQHSPETVWFAVAGWMALNLILFLGPLMVFAGPLYAVRERALIDYGRIVTRHHVAFQRKWIREAGSDEEFTGTSELSAISTVNSCINAVREMRLVPIDRGAVVQLVVAAGAPMLAVVATQVPMAELGKWFLDKIL